MDVEGMERDLRVLSEQMVRPGEDECLYCYLVRMLNEFGCNGHRFSEQWRDAQPRPLPGMMNWLSRNGGCCCDCEVVMNVFRPGRRTQRHRRFQCEASYQAALAAEAHDDEDAGI